MAIFPEAQRVPAWISAHPHLHGLSVSVAGIVVGGGLVWGVRLIGFWILKREAMGFGDVILMATIGSFLGWQPTVISFFIAATLGAAVGAAVWLFRRDREIPYGPYLSIAVLILLLAFKPVWSVAERIFDLGPLLPVFALFLGGALALSLQAVQLVKRALGIPLYDEQWIEEWSSADQLAHYAGQAVDAHQGRWRLREWEGKAAGRGTVYLEHWTRGCDSATGSRRLGATNRSGDSR
jgi:leader peptidase (prepilin peptidase)/N-methyltransferase